jgi:hypothetical protein
LDWAGVHAAVETALGVVVLIADLSVAAASDHSEERKREKERAFG